MWGQIKRILVSTYKEIFCEILFSVVRYHNNKFDYIMKNRSKKVKNKKRKRREREKEENR